MARRKNDDEGPIREEWPRIRAVTVKGVDYFQVDGRPQFKRMAFRSLEKARKQADKWENNRARQGKAGQFISERDATKVLEALSLLAPHGASIVEAARFYAGHLAKEKIRAEGTQVATALKEWEESYNAKDRDDGTKREIASKAKIFNRAMGHFKVGDLDAATLVKWIDGYEASPGKIAAPHTRAGIRTKLSQFLNFAKLKGWIQANPLDGFKIEKPPRAPVSIFDVKQVVRLIEAADRSENRAVVLPYAVICFFAGLRPSSEAEDIRWQDIHFATGDIHVRAETSKTREERFVPMEANLIAWLETCPHRPHGPIIGPTYMRFRDAWEAVKRTAGYRVGDVPEGGWHESAQGWPVDAMRHTYASMWLATHKSRAELAERMGNSETTIKSHYRRAIRPEVAKAFWGIAPKAKAGAKIVHIDSAAS